MVGKKDVIDSNPAFSRVATAFCIACTVPGPAEAHVGSMTKQIEICYLVAWMGRLPLTKSGILKTSASSFRSSMLRARNLTVSSVGEEILWPSVEITLCVGFRAKMPVKEAGRMKLPDVRQPRLMGRWKSATAAAEPRTFRVMGACCHGSRVRDRELCCCSFPHNESPGGTQNCHA